MKKITAIILTATAFALVSCGNEQSKRQQPETNFSCKAVINQDGEKFEAELQRIDGSGWNAVFTSPETIEGLEVSLLNDKCTVTFQGLTYTADREALPEYGILSLISAVEDNCISGKSENISVNGDIFTEQGSVHDFEYTAEIQGKYVVGIEIGEDFSADFSDFS